MIAREGRRIGRPRRVSTGAVAAAVGLVVTLVVLATPATAGDRPAPKTPTDAGPGRENFLDPLLEAAWKDAGVKTAAPASDEEFLRRAYLDLLGRIPSVEEARSFLGTRESGKRAKLIEHLLNHVDFPKDEEKKAEEKPATINVIAIADLDIVSEQFFELRRRKIENLDFDNVTFVLNCVDVLAGDESFVALRKKRPRHRTLMAIENQTRTFLEELQGQTKAAEDAAKDKLDEAQKAFDKQVDQVKDRKDLDERTKEIMLANLQAVAQRRLDVEKQQIEDEKLNQIREGKADSEQKTRAIENRVRFLASAIPPLPPLILGIFVFITRLRRENQGAVPTRLAT